MLWTGQFSSGRIGCGELKREARRVLWLRTEETRGGAHAGAQRGEGNEPGASTSPGDASRQAGCVPARAAAELDREPVIPIGSL